MTQGAVPSASNSDDGTSSPTETLAEVIQATPRDHRLTPSSAHVRHVMNPSRGRAAVPDEVYPAGFDEVRQTSRCRGSPFVT